MKNYRDYGPYPNTPALESCLIEIEDAAELTIIQMALEAYRESNKKLIEPLGSLKAFEYLPDPELCESFKQRCASIDKAIKDLSLKCYLPMSTFNPKKIKLGLWHSK